MVNGEKYNGDINRSFPSVNKPHFQSRGIDELECFIVCQFWLVQQRKTLLDLRKCKVLQLVLPLGPLGQENLTISSPH